MNDSPLAVEMIGIAKRFGECVANVDASISVRHGEIHALIGENGAGKSTLMKILYGLYTPDAGEIRINGSPISFTGPHDAISAGLGMVHQHFMLVPTLTAAENVVLGCEPTYAGGLLIDRARAIKETQALADKYALALDPQAKVSSLSVGEQQRLEILKILYRGADILILDEPTAVLTPQETTAFFNILRNLCAQGKTVILITHKLKEVLAISQNVTVMRAGRTVGAVTTTQASEASLAQLMVGRPVLFKVGRKPRSLAEIEASPSILRLENICANSTRGLPALRNLSLDVRAGEIFGIAGVEGNGQTELAEVVAGLRTPTTGALYWRGEPLATDRNSPAAMFARGLAHISEDRRRQGLVLDYSIAENIIFGRHRERAFALPRRLNFKAIADFARGLIATFDISPKNETLLIKTLSGGNQQKTIVARELSRKPSLLLACQLTRGVDVGAIEFIHKKIIEARDAGAAVLLISAELSEVLSLSDRVGVLYHGTLAGVFSADEADETKLGLLMTGTQHL